jgi:nucleoside-diphosphate-sugar epimerase
MDLSAERLGAMVDHARFEFVEGDIAINKEWIEYHVKKADVVLPLVAIATPATYVKNPLSVFELDFEENLRVVKMAAKYGRRVVFPSTSEVYGMCPDPEFDEDASPLVYGPINKPRWIYSASKQLLDRVIWALGSAQGLRFTLFRPFNWYGPRLDSIETAKEELRVVTQFIANLFLGEPIAGGRRKPAPLLHLRGRRDFRLDENSRKPQRCAAGRIFNIGNPKNDCSVRDLATCCETSIPGTCRRKNVPEIVEVDSKQFYGEGYQDIRTHPSIRRAKEYLGWSTIVGLREALARTLDAVLEENAPTKRRPGRGRPTVAGRGHS